MADCTIHYGFYVFDRGALQVHIWHDQERTLSCSFAHSEKLRYHFTGAELTDAKFDRNTQKCRRLIALHLLDEKPSKTLKYRAKIIAFIMSAQGTARIFVPVMRAYLADLEQL